MNFQQWKESLSDEQKAAINKYVDNSDKRGIIKETDRVGASARNTGKLLKYDSTKDFSIKIDGYPAVVNEGLSKATAKVARLGGETQTEHLILVDLKTGKHSYYEKGIEDQVGGKDFWKFIENNKSNNYAFVHNHNTAGMFSETDMYTLLKTSNINVFVATRIDGISYVVEKTKSIDINITFDKLYKDALEEINRKSRSGEISSAERTYLRETIIVENVIKDYTKGLIEFENGRKLGIGDA